MSMPAVVQEYVQVNYRPYGAGYELGLCRDLEVCLDGPAGTAKTTAALQKMHAALMKYPGARALISRKTHVSLTGSALVTYRKEVLHPGDGVKWFNGNNERPAGYQYPNGSEAIPLGLDRPDKIGSTAFDIALINQAEETDLESAEYIRTRLRNGVMPYQQLIYDVNPGAPNHWLNLRMRSGITKRLVSRHTDNPRWYDQRTGEMTEAGKVYILGTLAGLTGVRRSRLYLGEWVAAEGMVYESVWDARRNIAPRTTVSARPDGQDRLFGDCGIPRTWSRYIGIDFGFNNPFVCKWYAQDPDGRLIMYREIYMTHRRVDEHCATILKVAGWKFENGRLTQTSQHSDVLPRAVITDHDSEDRQTFTHHTGLQTVAAYKDVARGLQLVSARWAASGDGKPRLMYLEDSLVERDQDLVNAKQPTCSAEEVESYIWKKNGDGSYGEAPVKEFDHGQDTDRYVVCYFDARDTGVWTVKGFFH